MSLPAPPPTEGAPEHQPGRRFRMPLQRRWLLAGAAVLAVLVAVNAFVLDHQTARGSAGSGQLIPLPGGALHIDRSGPRTAPAIMMLPGLAESTGFWSRMVPLLNQRYDVIRVDLLGEGLSDKPGSGYGVDAQAALITALVRRLGLCRPLLVGHSLGGIVAVSAAAKSPALAGGLVLLDVPPRADTINLPIAAHLATWPALGELLHQIEPDWLIRQNLSNALAPGHPLPDFFVRAFNMMTFESFKHLEDEPIAFTSEHPVDQLAARARIAPLVIFGRDDKLVATRAWSLWQRVPGTQFRTIADAGHDAAWEQPRETAGLVARFASEHARHGCRQPSNLRG